MKPFSRTTFATTPVLIGVLLLLCALTFYYFAVLKIDYNRTNLLDLAPHSDATEYFAQARALLKDGKPSIQIAYDKLPSRYPFGYPLLMLPWLKILPAADVVLAPFQNKSNAGSGNPFGRLRVLHLPSDAADWRACDAFASDAPWLLHFLSVVHKRNQRIDVHCT